MRNIAQFSITKDGEVYTASGIELSIVTQAEDLDTLMEHIREAVALHFEGEDAAALSYSSSEPSILVNYELPMHA
ncbi:type II toxin-antitoxin system HicB family antitoxin [Patescibacteria group bacterium]|jgi:predicted RNase H-like HicB family nuclease|nr:type II toxin-antitoxin system HicB family antitoxin [Patescibacteria group bacterium]